MTTRRSSHTKQPSHAKRRAVMLRPGDGPWLLLLVVLSPFAAAAGIWTGLLLLVHVAGDSSADWIDKEPASCATECSEKSSREETRDD